MKPLAIIALFACTSAWAWGSLTSQSVNGSKRYCTYSDGTVITVNNYDPCPTTIK